MQIKLHSREVFTDATVGSLSVDNVFECFIREPGIRSDRLFIGGETALPAGHYNVSLEMSRRFSRLLPLLASTGPNHFDRRSVRLGIWIHPGHPREETYGVLLLGQEQSGRNVKRTAPAFAALFEKLVAAKARDEAIDFEIV